MRYQRSVNGHIEGKPLCTTIPLDLIRSVKVLARQESLRVNDIVIEAIEDLLIKYGTPSLNRK
jgi:NRPS condensation-like uncharacterized protein